MAFLPVSRAARRAYTRLQQGTSAETTMRLYLQSSHLVAMIVIALSVALLLAIRFRPATWRGVLCEAVVANLGAIAAVIAFEVLTA
jgi:hypothetical protein